MLCLLTVFLMILRIANCVLDPVMGTNNREESLEMMPLKAGPSKSSSNPTIASKSYDYYFKPGESESTWCFRMREKYHIEPGESFGELPSSLHSIYLSVKCYRFFCKPHPLAGRGKFRCEPPEKGNSKRSLVSWIFVGLLLIFLFISLQCPRLQWSLAIFEVANSFCIW